MSAVYQGMCNLPIPSHSVIVDPTTTGYDAPSGAVTSALAVIVPAPAVHQSAAEVRGSHRYPIRIQPHELRAGMRIGRRVLVGETAERRHGSHCFCHPSWWEPVVITADMVGPLNDLRWMCRCDCGTEDRVAVNALICGNGLSCGCYRRDRCAFLTAERNRARRTDFTHTTTSKAAA